MFLEEIIKKKKAFLEERKKFFPASFFSKNKTRFSGDAFYSALKKKSVNVIAEIKKASPSKGVFQADFDPFFYLEEYEAGGACAVSVLTEREYFLGSEEVFESLRARTRIPLLRKDFIFDEYQVFESAHMGANALLLIVRILEPQELRSLLALAAELGMAALVEVHSQQELDGALEAGAKAVGVNSRDLKTFRTDMALMENILSRIPPQLARVAESGIQSKEDILRLQGAGADAFLVGETLIRSKSPSGLLKSWIR